MFSRMARRSKWMLLVGLVVMLAGLSPVIKADSGVVTLGDTSGASPALAALNGRVYLGWTGTDGRLNVMSSANGISFTGKATLEEFSIAAPALASSGGSTSLAWTGTYSAHSLNVIRALGGAKEILGDTSIAAPALAILNNQLYLAWTGTDGAGLLNVRSFSLTPASAQTAFNWQWPDLSVTGTICIFGVCQGSVNQTQAFPADLADGVQRLGIQSSQLTQGSLPSTLSFSLNMANRTATLSGTISASTALQLVYDLLNSSGATVGTLRVAINILLSTGGAGGSGGSCCTLNFDALVQAGAIQTSVPTTIIVNGVPRTTPFTLPLGLGTAITMQAQSSVTPFPGGPTYNFKEWRSNVTGFLSNRNPLTGRVDRSETIQAIYAQGAGGGSTFSLTIRAVLQSTSQNIVGVPIATNFGTVLTPRVLPVPAGASFTATAPASLNISGVGTKTFQHWMECSSIGICGIRTTSKTLSVSSVSGSTEFRAVYN